MQSSAGCCACFEPAAGPPQTGRTGEARCALCARDLARCHFLPVICGVWGCSKRSGWCCGQYWQICAQFFTATHIFQQSRGLPSQVSLLSPGPDPEGKLRPIWVSHGCLKPNPSMSVVVLGHWPWLLGWACIPVGSVGSPPSSPPPPPFALVSFLPLATALTAHCVPSRAICRVAPQSTLLTPTPLTSPE